jgi:diphosphomevalonate decarboxylase
MESHPFKEQRFQRARDNFKRLVLALQAGDINDFIEVVEEEALTLHALMMTSTPSYILLKPQSLWLIEKIRNYRAEKNIPVCFTIDAGPNIHLLYPKFYESTVRSWIENHLATGLVGQKWIHDEVGEGPINLIGQ